jgi:hypothetical protein
MYNGIYKYKKQKKRKKAREFYFTAVQNNFSTEKPKIAHVARSRRLRIGIDST